MAEHRDAGDRAAWDLIPWVVAGSASATERSLVELHVAACADCAAELAFQTGVRSALGATLAASPDDGAGPGFRRLLARISAGDDAAPAAPRRRAGPRASRWLALACTLVVVQAVALGVLVAPAWKRPPPAAYATLSAPQTGRASLRLVPAPSLSLRELQALLARLDLQIVDASGDGVMFGAAPRQPGPAADATALAALRTAPGILLAEPIAGAGGAPAPLRP